MHVLITGANGFVGRALSSFLAADGRYIVRACARGDDPALSAIAKLEIIPDLTETTDWRKALVDIDTVVHAAARVHVMHDVSADPLSEFRQVNVKGTLKLASDAANAGVKRFVFLSSIKVNGEETPAGQPYTAGDEVSPCDPYGLSKLEAEQGLLALARQTGMEVVIIRPVLVYGPGVKGNFLSMMRWLDKGIPLPLGSLTANRRSIVAIDNLIDLIAVCLTHPAAANKVFLVSDGEDLSTTELLLRTAKALKKQARLLPLSPLILQFFAKLLRKEAVAQRLCRSLQVDIAKTTTLLGWHPRVSIDVALEKTALHFQKQEKR